VVTTSAGCNDSPSQTEGWQVTDEGLVRLPATWLARGIAWRPSAGRRLYAHAFVLPLYVPTQSLASN
jgi:hypothetical protein